MYIILMILIIDQVSKLLANKYLIERTRVKVLPFMDFYLVRNTGFAFSMLKNKKKLVIILHSFFIILIFYIYYMFKLNGYEKIALLIVGAGGFSNLLDRYIRSSVIDFIDFKFKKSPIFNLADLFILFGVGYDLFYEVFA